MNKVDMILISVDDHIVEPPDMFKNHLSKKYLDEAPRLVHNPDGSDTWQFRDVVIPNVGALSQGIPAFGDSIGGMNIAGGISAALFHRERTGEATEIDVSLLSTAWWAAGASVTQGMERARPCARPCRAPLARRSIRSWAIT